MTRRDGKGVLSCGCLQRENRIKHGAYSSDSDIDYHIKYSLLQAIKDRSKRKGYESDLELDDMPSIPVLCPVLEVPLHKHRNQHGKGKGRGQNRRDDSPSIDRLNSNLPYLKKYKDNLFVISWRANKLKSNASIKELEMIVKYMRQGAPS